MQSSVRWEHTSLWNITSVRAAGLAPSKTRRVSWSVSPALREPPRPTCTPAALLSAKVRYIHTFRTSVLSVSEYCSQCGGLRVFAGQCKPGSHSLNGLEICESCPLGHFQPGFGARECLVCPDETSTVTRGAVDETECGGDTVWQCGVHSPNVLSTCLF